MRRFFLGVLVGGGVQLLAGVAPRDVVAATGGASGASVGWGLRAATAASGCGVLGRGLVEGDIGVYGRRVGCRVEMGEWLLVHYSYFLDDKINGWCRGGLFSVV